MNNSFLKVAKILKQNGVKNTEFLIQTIDPDVVGLDPYDLKLTHEDKRKILAECKRNIWYFFREVAKIPTIENEIVDFELNVNTCALIYLFQNEINAWVSSPRQTFSTSTMIECSVWNEIFKNIQTDIIHPKSNSDERSIQTKKKNIIKVLPSYIKNCNQGFKSNVIMIDDAELLKYDEFKWIKKTSDRYYFSSVIIDKCDDKLIKEIESFPKFTYDMYNSKIKHKLVRVIYPPEIVYSSPNDIEHMKKILPDTAFQREVMLKRI